MQYTYFGIFIRALLVRSDVISMRNYALMNIIATDFPEYADRINSRLENDEDMIAQKPDAGRDFLRLPR